MRSYNHLLGFLWQAASLLKVYLWVASPLKVCLCKAASLPKVDSPLKEYLFKVDSLLKVLSLQYRVAFHHLARSKVLYTPRKAHTLLKDSRQAEYTLRKVLLLQVSRRKDSHQVVTSHNKVLYHPKVLLPLHRLTVLQPH